MIVDLDVDRTIHGFSLLSGFSPEKVKSIYTTSAVFYDYEKGLVDDNAFRDNIRDMFNSGHVTDDEINRVWNAMLLGIPVSKLKLMERLKERYQVLILSNTNNIHMQVMHTKILPLTAGVSSFDSFVHKAYYSYVVRMRKPDAEIYQYVLDDLKLNAGETVFLDDNADNIKGAEQLKIKVKHITNSNQIFELFD